MFQPPGVVFVTECMQLLIAARAVLFLLSLASVTVDSVETIRDGCHVSYVVIKISYLVATSCHFLTSLFILLGSPEDRPRQVARLLNYIYLATTVVHLILSAALPRVNDPCFSRPIYSTLYVIFCTLTMLALLTLIPSCMAHSEPPSHPAVEVSLLRVVTYSEDLSKEKGLVTCSICLLDYRKEDCLRELLCHHYFHRECIETWFHERPTCPLCRRVQTSDISITLE